MTDWFARFRRDETGATAIEYGLIVGLIFLAIVTSLSLLGGNTSGLYNRAMTAIANALA